MREASTGHQHSPSPQQQVWKLLEKCPKGFHAQRSLGCWGTRACGQRVPSVQSYGPQPGDIMADRTFKGPSCPQ